MHIGGEIAHLRHQIGLSQLEFLLLVHYRNVNVGPAAQLEEKNIRLNRPKINAIK